MLLWCFLYVSINVPSLGVPTWGVQVFEWDWGVCGGQIPKCVQVPNIARKMYSTTDWTLSTLQDWKNLGVLYSTQSPLTTRRADCKIE